MTIGALYGGSFYGYDVGYRAGSENTGQSADGEQSVGAAKDDRALPNGTGILPAKEQTAGQTDGDGQKAGQTSSSEECETCKNRKYQDGSDEMVSFKSAAHISPQASASRVRAHEQEHVSNAYSKAATGDGKVVSASVSIHTAICPECGRTYVSGGETRTQIKYYNEENPYQQGKKTADASVYAGMNIDAAV